MSSNQIHDRVILVPSQRMTWDVYYKYSKALQSAGQPVEPFEKFNIYTIDTYLQELLFNALCPVNVLTHAQELLMMKRCIDVDDNGVLSSISLARSVAQASRYIEEYKLSRDPDYYLGSDESRYLNVWLERFDSLKGSSNSISRYQLKNVCSDLLKAGKIKFPSNVIMLGFIDLDQPTLDLIDSIQKSGSTVVTQSMVNYKPEKVKPVLFTNPSDEILYCAKWAKLLSSQLSNNEYLSVAVPNIDEYRDVINDVFSSVMGGVGEPIWDIGGGVSLVSYPEVQSLLDLISIDLLDIDIEILQRVSLSKCLDLGLSPYRAGMFISKMRAMRKKSYTLSDCVCCLKGLLKESDSFVKAINAFQSLQSISLNSEDTLSLNDWTKTFIQLLDKGGWMMGRRDDPLYTRCIQELISFRGLSKFTGNVSRMPAVTWLREHFSVNRFAYPRQTKSLIHVVSYKDAMGTSSVGTWVIGLTSDVMPGDMPKNSLLPYSLSKDKKFKFSSWDLFNELKEKELKALLSSGRNIVCSVSQLNEKGGKQLPCGMLDVFKDAPLIHGHHKLIDDSIAVYPTGCTGRFPPVLSEELNKLTGSTGLLDELARNPFSAVVKHRFKIRPIESEIGISYSEQGDLLHGCMEMLWNKYPSTNDLSALGVEKIGVNLKKCLEEVSCKMKLPDKYGLSITRLEIEQTANIALDAILRILSGPSFSVLGNEIPITGCIKGLTFNLKLDQARDYGNGGACLIDYKRSKNIKHNWLKKCDETPDSYQLPLYKRFYQGLVNGIGLSKIHPDVGVEVILGTNNGFDNKIDQDSFETLGMAWNDDIDVIIGQFLEGNVKKDGYFYPNSHEIRIDRLKTHYYSS